MTLIRYLRVVSISLRYIITEHIINHLCDNWFTTLRWMILSLILDDPNHVGITCIGLPHLLSYDDWGWCLLFWVVFIHSLILLRNTKSEVISNRGFTRWLIKEHIYSFTLLIHLWTPLPKHNFIPFNNKLLLFRWRFFHYYYFVLINIGK